MELSLVIPAYNEQRWIESTIRQSFDYLTAAGFDYEIIVVDDGSTDKTADLALQFSHPRFRLLRNGKNRGKGFSVNAGMRLAKKEWVLFLDADLSTGLDALEKFRIHLDCYDIFIGSRAMADSVIVVSQPWYRSLPGKIFPHLVRLLVLKGFYDTQCGFKMFRRSCLKELLNRQTVFGWAFDVELLLIAQRQGLRIREVPVLWHNDLDSKLNPVINSLSMLVELLQIRCQDLRGLYN